LVQNGYTVYAAAVAKRPKTRYATGGGAEIVLFLRKIILDKMFDKLMLRMMK
jgi:hypothetical protein